MTRKKKTTTILEKKTTTILEKNYPTIFTSTVLSSRHIPAIGAVAPYERFNLWNQNVD